MHGMRAPEQASDPQGQKVTLCIRSRRGRAGSRSDTREGKVTDFLELLRQELRNFESLLRVLERAGFLPSSSEGGHDCREG